MTPYASHSKCRVLSCWCVNERSVVLLPPLLVYSILSLFSPRSPSPVYMVSELVGWGREKSKEVVPRTATPPWWAKKSNCLRLRCPSRRRKYTRRYTEVYKLLQLAIRFGRVSSALWPREQKLGSSRNLIFLEGGLLRHRDAFLKCTEGA